MPHVNTNQTTHCTSHMSIHFCLKRNNCAQTTHTFRHISDCILQQMGRQMGFTCLNIFPHMITFHYFTACKPNLRYQENKAFFEKKSTVSIQTKQSHTRCAAICFSSKLKPAACSLLLLAVVAQWRTKEPKTLWHSLALSSTLWQAVALCGRRGQTQSETDTNHPHADSRQTDKLPIIGEL